jgi:flagellar biosynthesis protein FliR
VFIVGLPIKVGLGLTIIFLTMPFLADAFGMIMEDIVQSIGRMIMGMIPWGES